MFSESASEMTTTTNLPAVADGADNVLANAGQAVIHTSETLLGDIVALFSGTTYGACVSRSDRSHRVCGLCRPRGT